MPKLLALTIFLLMSAFLKITLDLGRKDVSTQTKKIILPGLEEVLFQLDNNLGNEGIAETELPGLMTRLVWKEFGKTEMHSSCHFEFLILLHFSLRS